MNPRDWSPPVVHDDQDRCPTGIAVAVGAAAMVGAAMASTVLTQAPGPRLAVMVAAVGVFALAAGDGRAAVAVAGLAWPIGNGFLVNRFGVLTWHARLDSWFVVGLLAAVSVGMLIAQVRRELRSRRRWRPVTDVLLDAEARPNMTSTADQWRTPARGRIGYGTKRYPMPGSVWR